MYCNPETSEMVLASSKSHLGFEMAIRFILPFRNGHGHFKIANGFKTASNIYTEPTPHVHGHMIYK